MPDQPRISVALCTYNGERFLREQLDSFVEQSVLPYELVVCDDASTDSTFTVLEEFSRTAPFPVRLFRNENNLGVVQNFSKAVYLCAGDYVALSDQDDVWLPGKLEASIEMMRQGEQVHGSDTPLLVHTDLRLVDSEKREIAPSYMRHQHLTHRDIDPLKTILARNFVTGCTCLCNRALIRESHPFPEKIFMHDWWLALIAASRGKILFVPEAKILYRQHGSNSLGARSLIYYNIKEFIKPSRKQRAIRTMLELLEIAMELKKRLSDLSCDEHPYLASYIEAFQKGGILNAFLIIFLIKVRTQGFLPNLRFYYRISRRQYARHRRALPRDEC